MGSRPAERAWGIGAAVVLAFAGCAAEAPPLPCPIDVHDVYGSRLLEPWQVSLLFVIDSSSEMGPAQAALAAEVPRIVSMLATGDMRYADGTAVWAYPRRVVHVGVVTADMGDGVGLGSCGESGDDGVLTRDATFDDPSCPTTDPPFLDFGPLADDTTRDAVADAARCKVSVGTDGCDVAQPLEASLKAVASSFDRIEFSTGGSRSGHGDVANRNFTTDVFAVVVLTNQDDCSLLDPGLFDEASAYYAGSRATRCIDYGPALQPIDRYVEGLATLGLMPPGNLDRKAFVAIAGVPPELVDGPATDFAAILADPRMQPSHAVDDPERVSPACSSSGLGPATPARRLTTLAQEIDARGGAASVKSLCGSMHDAADAILGTIASAAGDVYCTARPLPTDETGLLRCEMIETIATADGGCDSLRAIGRVPRACTDLTDGNGDGLPDCEGVPVTPHPFGDGLEECRVLQTRLDPETGEPEGIGFYYDAFSPMAEEHCWSGVRVPLTRGAERPPVAVLSQLDCTNTLDGYAFVDAEGVGTPCNGAPTDPCRDLTSDAFPDGLFCDGFTERCEPACETDADCGGAGRVCLNESIDHRAFVPFCVRAAACGE